MKILIVDDEVKIANALAERFHLRGFDAVPAYNGKSALDLLKTETFDGVVLDLRLPDIDGIEVLRQTLEEFPEIRVIILSGHGTEQDFKTCLEMGAIACFHKPASILKLTKALAEPQSKNNEDIPTSHQPD